MNESSHASTDAPFGVCIFPPPARNAARTVGCAEYAREILAHAGLCCAFVTADELPGRLSGFRLLLTIGEFTPPGALGDQLRMWVEEGGSWLSVGGVCGLADLFGATVEPPAYTSWGGGASTLGEGYLEAATISHPILTHVRVPLHFFNGVPVQPAGVDALARILDAHGRPTPRAAVLERQAGKGRCLLIAPDVTGTIVRIQQGIAVTRDGVPAPDGTAPNADLVLKSGDGGVLDWHFDRQPVPGVPGLKAFLEPVADQWVELLLRGLFYLAAAQELALPLLWYYPRNLPALGHMSHDTDGNDPEKAVRLLEVLRGAGARSTWCVILPGYPADLIAAIRDAGHELAMHFDAMSEGLGWNEMAFEQQWRQLATLFGGQAPVSNKNHYLRWEGDTELFEWCAGRGIRLDQSKGASKTGEAGFNFGTCHPFRPVGPDGRLIDVLELPTPTQDLAVFAPPELLQPLVEAVERHHGVLHLLFHPAHVERPGVAAALSGGVACARERGMEWWTAEELALWERARRRAQWTGCRLGPGVATRLFRAGEPLPGATLLWLSTVEGRITIDGSPAPSHRLERWGFGFQSVVFDAAAGHDYEIAFTTQPPDC
jgi:hypothetical protein